MRAPAASLYKFEAKVQVTRLDLLCCCGCIKSGMQHCFVVGSFPFSPSTRVCAFLVEGLHPFICRFQPSHLSLSLFLLLHLAEHILFYFPSHTHLSACNHSKSSLDALGDSNLLCSVPTPSVSSRVRLCAASEAFPSNTVIYACRSSILILKPLDCRYCTHPIDSRKTGLRQHGQASLHRCSRGHCSIGFSSIAELAQLCCLTSCWRSEW